jgi:hypothetical protein
VTPSLEGVHGKVGRAKHHLDELKRVLSERNGPNPIDRQWLDDESKRRVLETTLDDVPEVPLEARLLIGDIAHNLATSLDHLVYQLSLSHQIAIGTPDPVALCDSAKTHFPIYAAIDNDSLKTLNKRLKLMAPAPADIIRAMQPYKRSEDDPTLIATEDPLWILFRLDVIDKHRVVLATNEEVSLRHVTVTMPGQTPRVFEIPNPEWQPLKAGAPVFNFQLPPDYELHPEVRFQLDLGLSIGFAETGLFCDGKPVVELFRKLIGYIEQFVIKRLSPHVIRGSTTPA